MPSKPPLTSRSHASPRGDVERQRDTSSTSPRSPAALLAGASGPGAGALPVTLMTSGGASAASAPTLQASEARAAVRGAPVAAAPPSSAHICGMNAGLFAALAYAFVSVTITLFNKSVLTMYAFDATFTLTLLQGLVTITALEGMKRMRVIEYPDFDWAVARKVAPLSFVFIAYVIISLVSLGRVNVPMFTALRRVTVVFVMAAEYRLLGITPSRRVLQAVGLMCAGAGLAAWKDLSFDSTSYFFLFLTNLFTALYTVYINVIRKETGLNVWAMMFYNNVTTMPVLAALAWYTGDLQRAWNHGSMRDPLFQINFQASIWLAFMLNVATFFCTTLNSARTQTVVGQLKNFVAFLLGLAV